ncbi:MAG: IPT/TIG domain-containing protein, partial [bacterium]
MGFSKEGFRAFLFAIFLLILLFSPLSTAYAQPHIDSIDPNTGHQGESELIVTIHGSGFQVLATAYFENSEIIVTNINFIDSGTLECEIDIGYLAALGPGTVFVVNYDPALQAALVNGFTVIAPDPPEPTDADPDSGYTGDTGLPVTIHGDLLYTAEDVDFGAGVETDSIVSVSAHEIQCIVSINWLATPGFRDVTVLSPYGDGVIPSGFEVLNYPPPNITGLDPIFGLQGEFGKEITVTGADFLDGI